MLRALASKSCMHILWKLVMICSYKYYTCWLHICFIPRVSSRVGCILAAMFLFEVVSSVFSQVVAIDLRIHSNTSITRVSAISSDKIAIKALGDLGSDYFRHTITILP